MAALFLVLEWLGIAAAAVLLISPGDGLTVVLGLAGLALAVLARCTRPAGARGGR